MIRLPLLTSKKAKEEYRELWETAQFMLSLNDLTTALVVSLVVGVCPHCHAASRGCQCWNDE